MTATIAIVGTSIAGVRTAQTLRSSGFDGRVVLIGEETDPPYDRPPLSKEFLTGAWDRSRISLLTPAEAATASIDMQLGVAATRLEADSKEVVLADGRRIAYDTCVIATGASARPSPWAGQRAHVVRQLADSSALRHALQTSTGRVAVVGAGFIGAEVASAAKAMGREVLLLDPLPTPIARIVGTRIGELLLDLPARAGIATRLGVGVEAVIEERTRSVLRLTDGSEVDAATVVVGIGATPNDSWLLASDVLVRDGLVCDEYLRACGRRDVYGVGDVARWFHVDRGERVRMEHWTNAVEQAACVAHNIVNPATPRAYRPVEYVWSDQFGCKIQVAGQLHLATDHELIGQLDGPVPRSAVLGTDGSGQLVRAMAVNWPRALVECRRLLTTGVTYGEALTRLGQLPLPLGAGQ